MRISTTFIVLFAFTGCVDQDSAVVSDASVTVDTAILGDMGADAALVSDGAQPDGLLPDAMTTPEDASTGPECVVVGSPNTCDPNPPHRDMVGQVCANDGTDEEAYCVYNANGDMVCGRSEAGGPCLDGAAPPTQDAGVPPDSGVDPPNTGTFPARPIDMNDPMARFFSQEASVFGVRLVATATVPSAKLSHAATVMAEYLDNDEDGIPDDLAVVQSMRSRRALLVMFASSAELERSGVFESNVLEGYWGQDLQADETNVPGRFDATLEEVLHLISSAGYSPVYPEAFGERAGTLLTDAMDLARGGRFNAVPNQYPEGAWYHYDDRTCDYRCMATEYFYWALTTLLGAQDAPERCAEIAREWEPCTALQLEMRDPAVHRLLTDPQYKLPTVLPDGVYRGQ